MIWNDQDFNALVEAIGKFEQVESIKLSSCSLYRPPLRLATKVLERIAFRLKHLKLCEFEFVGDAQRLRDFTSALGRAVCLESFEQIFLFRIYDDNGYMGRLPVNCIVAEVLKHQFLRKINIFSALVFSERNEPCCCPDTILALLASNKIHDFTLIWDSNFEQAERGFWNSPQLAGALKINTSMRKLEVSDVTSRHLTLATPFIINACIQSLTLRELKLGICFFHNDEFSPLLIRIAKALSSNAESLLRKIQVECETTTCTPLIHDSVFAEYRKLLQSNFNLQTIQFLFGGVQARQPADDPEIGLYLRLNQLGRKELMSDDPQRVPLEKWVNALSHLNDAGALFYYLQLYPWLLEAGKAKKRQNPSGQAEPPAGAKRARLEGVGTNDADDQDEDKKPAAIDDLSTAEEIRILRAENAKMKKELAELRAKNA